MKQRLRLSIVIPAYNEERYLRDCLKAIRYQTLEPYEVIVVDNNSTDRTAEIAAEFPFVRLVREKRQGLRFARNAGLNAAQGDIIGRIDADTFLDARWCERLLRAFEDPRVTCVTGACFYHDMPWRETGYVLDKLCRSLAFTAGRPMLYGSNMALRRGVWQQLRPIVCMQGEFFEDGDLTVHANQLGYGVTYVPGAIAGVSARRLDNSPLEFYRTMQEYDHTFRMHGQRNATAATARAVFMGAYPFLKLVRKCYDTETDRFVLSRLRAPRAVPRPTSNT